MKKRSSKAVAMKNNKDNSNEANLFKRKYVFGWRDMSSVKIAVICFTLFVVSLLNDDFVGKIKSLQWIWLVLAILFSIRPLCKVWGKK